jgi:hypothetical protein
MKLLILFKLDSNHFFEQCPLEHCCTKRHQPHLPLRSCPRFWTPLKPGFNPEAVPEDGWMVVSIDLKSEPYPRLEHDRHDRVGHRDEDVAGARVHRGAGGPG